MKRSIFLIPMMKNISVLVFACALRFLYIDDDTAPSVTLAVFTGMAFLYSGSLYCAWR